jgi:hypothetical protein
MKGIVDTDLDVYDVYLLSSFEAIYLPSCFEAIYLASALSSPSVFHSSLITPTMLCTKNSRSHFDITTQVFLTPDETISSIDIPLRHSFSPFLNSKAIPNTE